MEMVVRKPVFKENIKMFKEREIQAAMEKVGIRNKEGFSVHLHEKANTIAITTTNPHLS